MNAPTHKEMAFTLTTGTCAVAGLSIWATIPLAATAVGTTMLADKIETPLGPDGPRLFKHRGITHRPEAALVIPLALAATLVAVLRLAPIALTAILKNPVPTIPSQITLIAALLVICGTVPGYMVHLYADSLTIMGATGYGKDKYGKPRRIHLLPKPLRIHTGGRSEAAFQFVLFLVWLGVMYFTIGPTVEAFVNAR